MFVTIEDTMIEYLTFLKYDPLAAEKLRNPQDLSQRLRSFLVLILITPILILI